MYFDKEHQQITQIPILLRLLELMGFPGLPDLRDDLLNGFEVYSVSSTRMRLEPQTG